MRNYAFIQHPKRGKIKFDLFDFQTDVLDDFRRHQYNIVLKSRQMGLSTLIAGYSLWMMLFHNDKNILVIATKQDTAKNLVTKVRVMYDNLPSWLKTRTVEDNKLSLRFENGSQIKASSAASDAARSEALSLLVIDEAAFINGIEEIWASAQQTLATGGQAIINSTPNGVGNFYHKTWVDATTNDRSPFHPIFLHWKLHPERDQAWRDKQDEVLGPQKAKQECDGSFLASGMSVISGEELEWYRENQLSAPIEKRGVDSSLWIWEYPHPDKSYIVVADVARGDGSDFSAFHVIDVENVEQVAEFKAMLGTTQYGDILMNIATEYNDALLVVENANIGWAVIQRIIDRGYDNLYYTFKDEGFIDPAIQLSKGYDLKDKSEMVPGFTTSQRTRPLIITKLIEFVREHSCVIHSARLIEELSVFIWKGSRAEAQSGYNDDLVMAYAIGLWVRDMALRLRELGLSRTRSTLDALANVRPVRSTLDTPATQLRQHGWSMPSPHGDQDLRWLIDKID